MAKHRYIKDSFWTDPYIEKLSPDYKLVFLYLLTNPLCNIAGVYEIRLKRMSFEMGYDTEVVENILKQFVKDKKIIMFESWIVIVNHLKHQSLGSDTAKGVNREILSAPEELSSLFEEKEMSNTKGDVYPVLVLKEDITPPIDPLHTPHFGAYSGVKLNRIELSNIKEVKIQEKMFGEFENVKLSEEELQKLKEKLGEHNTNLLIEELSGYLASTRKKYANHYATLLNWARRKYQEKQNKSANKTKTITVIQ